MALNPKLVDRLLLMIQQTREEELACPECLDELDRYAQALLDGMPPEGVLRDVQAHLEVCPFCKEEFELIIETLKSAED